MITFARAAISRIAVYISSARDQRMAQPVPPPVIGCQPGETDHGLSESSSRDGHRRLISSTNRAISGPSGGSGSSAPVTNRCSSASSSWRTSQTVLGPEGGNALRSKLTPPSSLLSFPNRRQVAPAWKASGPATLTGGAGRLARVLHEETGMRFVFNPHAESHVETDEQVRRFLADTDPERVARSDGARRAHAWARRAGSGGCVRVSSPPSG
jgi:hypothetical protein